MKVETEPVLKIAFASYWVLSHTDVYCMSTFIWVQGFVFTFSRPFKNRDLIYCPHYHLSTYNNWLILIILILVIVHCWCLTENRSGVWTPTCTPPRMTTNTGCTGGTCTLLRRQVSFTPSHVLLVDWMKSVCLLELEGGLRSAKNQKCTGLSNSLWAG